MGTKWKGIKWIIFIIIIFCLAIPYILIETDLTYSKTTVQPIKIDWRVFEFYQLVNISNFSPNQSGRIISVNLWVENGMPTNKSIIHLRIPPNYNISQILFFVKNPFLSNITGEIETTPYLGNTFVDFFIVNNVTYAQFNNTRINEYKSQNPKDVILTSTLFSGGNFSTWVEVWAYFSSQHSFNIQTNSFFQQTSFDRWEALYLFDRSVRDYIYQNISYEDANINQLVFSVSVPVGYSIQDPENQNLAMDKEGNVIITKVLQGGETLHLTITNDVNTYIKSIAGNIIIAIGIFSSLISFFYTKIKEKIEKLFKK